MNDQSSLSDWIGKSQLELALVFADIVGSTDTVFKVGTVPYSDLRRMLLQTAQRLLDQHHGRLVDKTGDGLFCAFHDTPDAFNFARGLFWDRDLRTVLRVRVGLHRGIVTVHGDELIGRNVHYAARVMQHGSGAEFWVSAAAKDELDRRSAHHPAFLFETMQEAELRGIPGAQCLWRAG